jgi:hypothetical protein
LRVVLEVLEELWQFLEHLSVWIVLVHVLVAIVELEVVGFDAVAFPLFL